MSDHDDEDDLTPDSDHDDGADGWEEEPAADPDSERRVAVFQRLMEAETRLHEWWEQRQTTTTWVTELLGHPVEDNTDLWISALGEKVAAMGGHLELTAVFDNETLTLLRESGSDPSSA
ncbi:MAG: hypothetical protein ACRDNS_03775 [Trebonia sp.]